MPCACKHPPINVPDNLEWGPLLWKLLHALAEKAGSAPMVGLRGDEIRAWTAILGTLGKTLPCEVCRDHFNGYVSGHPIVIPDNYANIREYIRRWIYELHNDVNCRTDKEAYAYERLNEVYGWVNLRETWGVLDVLMKRAILGSALPLLSWTKWSAHVKTLFGMYC